MNRILLTIAFAVAVIPSLPTVATGGAATSGGKAGSTSAMASKGSSSSQHCEVKVIRGFGGIRDFGSSTTVEGPSFLIVDARPLEAQVYLDGRPFGSATLTPSRSHQIDIPFGSSRRASSHTVPSSSPIRVSRPVCESRCPLSEALNLRKRIVFAAVPSRQGVPPREPVTARGLCAGTVNLSKIRGCVYHPPIT
jgi:hypothetical protein